MLGPDAIDLVRYAEVVKLLRGELGLESEPGKGTIVTLWLPLAAEVAPAIEEPSEEG